MDCLLMKQENQKKTEKKMYAYDTETKGVYVIDMKRAQLKSSETLAIGLTYAVMMMSGIFLFLYLRSVSSWFVFVSLIVWACGNIVLLDGTVQKTIKKAKAQNLIEQYSQLSLTEEAIKLNPVFFNRLAQYLKLDKQIECISVILSSVIISVICLLILNNTENYFFIYVLSFICSWTLYPVFAKLFQRKKTKEAVKYVKHLIHIYEQMNMK